MYAEMNERLKSRPPSISSISRWLTAVARVFIRFLSSLGICLRLHLQPTHETTLAVNYQSIYQSFYLSIAMDAFHPFAQFRRNSVIRIFPLEPNLCVLPNYWLNPINLMPPIEPHHIFANGLHPPIPLLHPLFAAPMPPRFVTPNPLPFDIVRPFVPFEYFEAFNYNRTIEVRRPNVSSMVDGSGAANTEQTDRMYSGIAAGAPTTHVIRHNVKKTGDYLSIYSV